MGCLLMLVALWLVLSPSFTVETHSIWWVVFLVGVIWPQEDKQ